MYEKRLDKLMVFSISLIVSLIFWRGWVYLFSGVEKVSFLRGVTGLNIHHYHYGMFLVLIVMLIFIFYRVNNFLIALVGFGFGTYFDGFVSRLFKSGTRADEIFNYYNNLFPTILLFGVLIVLAFVFYRISEKYFVRR